MPLESVEIVRSQHGFLEQLEECRSTPGLGIDPIEGRTSRVLCQCPSICPFFVEFRGLPAVVDRRPDSRSRVLLEDLDWTRRQSQPFSSQYHSTNAYSPRGISSCFTMITVLVSFVPISGKRLTNGDIGMLCTPFRMPNSARIVHGSLDRPALAWGCFSSTNGGRIAPKAMRIR